MKFEILNRFTGKVNFTAEIEADENSPKSLKIGLPVKWAIKNRANLIRADLSDADLSDADLSDADLSDADLSDANLSGANLSGANLIRANLIRANLIRANLSDADLSGANLSDTADWMPKIENIHQKVYASASSESGLDMSSWHTCETTHCRAGWVTHLAGEGGRVLEGVYGTSAAAALIYFNSDKNLEKVPNFHCSNREALDDMKRLAEIEATN